MVSVDRAVIYIPAGTEPGKWMPRCLEYCARRGYRVVAVVDQGPWDDVWAMLADGQVEVAVVSRIDHLPAQRKPRVEEAVDWGPQIDGGRRPRTIR